MCTTMSPSATTLTAPLCRCLSTLRHCDKLLQEHVTMVPCLEKGPETMIVVLRCSDCSLIRHHWWSPSSCGIASESALVCCSSCTARTAWTCCRPASSQNLASRRPMPTALRSSCACARRRRLWAQRRSSSRRRLCGEPPGNHSDTIMPAGAIADGHQPANPS